MFDTVLRGLLPISMFWCKNYCFYNLLVLAVKSLTVFWPNLHQILIVCQNMHEHFLWEWRLFWPNHFLQVPFVFFDKRASTILLKFVLKLSWKPVNIKKRLLSTSQGPGLTFKDKTKDNLCFPRLLRQWKSKDIYRRSTTFNKKKTVLVWYIDTLENLKKGGEKAGESSCFRLPKS